MGLPDGRKSFKIGLAVLIQYRRVTATHLLAPSRPRCRSIYRFMLRVAQVKKTSVMVLLSRQRSLTISSVVWIQCTNVTAGRTDRYTDGQRATAKTALTH